jgi:hypothetical protein
MQGSDSNAGAHGAAIRLGGLAILVGFAIHMVANLVIKRMPPEHASIEELRIYLDLEVGRWAAVHGMRYIAIVSIVVFAAAMFARTCCLRSVRPISWGVVGLLGAMLMLTNLMVTNGVETFIFLDDSLVSSNTDIFWALFNTTRVLFTAEVMTWGVFIGGFSVAAWQSATLPKWLIVLGVVSALFSILSGVFIVLILTDGWATILIEIASLSGLAWFLCAGVYLLIRGDSLPDGAS